MRVPDDVARAADNMAKDTHLSFRDCLDILMRTYLTKVNREQLDRVGASPTSRNSYSIRTLVPVS